MTHSEQRILVMGVGNPLMRDDGIGPRIVEVLRAGFVFPPHVDVVDAGTLSYMILDMLRGIDALILVDAIQGTDDPPGTVVVMSPEEIAPNQVRHSMHDVGIVDVLQAASLIGRAPQTVVIGIRIESIEQWELELSDAVEASIPRAVEAVLTELAELGVRPARNEGADIHASILSALRTYEPMPDANARTRDS